jgi:hypothetical protein
LPDKKTPRKVDHPDTPSGKALAEVGDLDGEDVKPADVAKANEHGEAYQAAKRKHRWG